jgi:O-antigen ligase
VVWNGVCFWIASYIIWASVTLLWTSNIAEGRGKLIAYGIGLILIFLILNQVRSVDAIDEFMRLPRFFGWFMIGQGFLAMALTHFQFGDRLNVIGWNENEFGEALILMIPGVMWPVVRSSRLQRRFRFILSIAFIFCTLVLVLATGSRGSVLSMAVMLLAFLFWKPVRPWGFVGLVLVLGVIAAAPFLLASINNRFDEDWGNQLGDRDFLWQASLRLISDVPLTGVGEGNGPAALRPYVTSLTNDFELASDKPSHNPLLEVGVETGLIGLTIYTALCATALWQFFRQHPLREASNDPLAAYFPVVLCATVGYLFSWVKSGGMENHPTFFLLLALLTIPSQLPRNSGQASQETNRCAKQTHSEGVVAQGPARRVLSKARPRSANSRRADHHWYQNRGGDQSSRPA